MHVNHLKSLRQLCTADECGINQAGIAELRNLEYLVAVNNPNITNINHLKRLHNLFLTNSGIVKDEIDYTNNSLLTIHC